MTDKQKDEADQAFVRKIRTILDQSVDDLDAVVSARLSGARHRALEVEKRPHRIGILPVAGLASITVAMLAAVLWLHVPSQQAPGIPVEDLELLVSSESLEFYEELEFYEWLEEHDALPG